MQADLVLAAANAKMPFGKYQGRSLIELPEPYLVWFSQQGFPSGLLGEQLACIYELKLNGLEKLFERGKQGYNFKALP